MFRTNPVSAVLVSTDLDRAERFYADRLGLPLAPETIKNHLVFDCGEGTSLLVYGRPTPNQADHTQVRFWTADIDADVAELKAAGVIFQDYDTQWIKTVDSIATTAGIGRSAWFLDPDGNTIALFQPE